MQQRLVVKKEQETDKFAPERNCFIDWRPGVGGQGGRTEAEVERLRGVQTSIEGRGRKIGGRQAVIETNAGTFRGLKTAAYIVRLYWLGLKVTQYSDRRMRAISWLNWKQLNGTPTIVGHVTEMILSYYDAVRKTTRIQVTWPRSIQKRIIV